MSSSEECGCSRWPWSLLQAMSLEGDCLYCSKKGPATFLPQPVQGKLTGSCRRDTGTSDADPASLSFYQQINISRLLHPGIISSKEDSSTCPRGAVSLPSFARGSPTPFPNTAHLQGGGRCGKGPAPLAHRTQSSPS